MIERMKFPCVDGSNYNPINQAKKVEEEFTELCIAFSSLDKDAVIAETLDVIQSCITLLEILNVGEEELRKHFYKIKSYETQGKLKLKGELQIEFKKYDKE